MEASQRFLAHVTELLAAAGDRVHDLLQEPRESLDGCGLEESFRRQYAEDLAAEDATWQIAPFYLAQCPVLGQQTLETLLVERSSSAGRDPEVLKLLDICREYGMDEAAIKICRNVGVHRWQQNRRASAIAWLQRGRDDKRLDAIAHELCQQVTQGEGEGLEAVGMLLDNVSTDLPLSGSLAFLQRYRKLQATLALLRAPPLEELPAQLAAAGETIVSLLTPGMAPRQFWLTLLFDAVPLLEWPGFPVFDTQQTFHLMTCLEELRTSHLHEEYLKKGGEAVDALSLQRLDLALATNLGRAFIRGADRT